MSTRSLVLLASCAALLSACSSSESASDTPPGDADAGEDGGSKKPPPVPVQPVFIGSGGFGFAVGSAWPGAAAPQGMAKVGPDTSGAEWGTTRFLHFSGYWYGDDTIQGFSHMHLHGTGATDYGVLALMPLDAFDAKSTTTAGYASKFQKSSEQGVPGKYSVTLDRGDIGVELTATPHAAHHRYTYPASATAAHVVFDLDHHLEGGTVKDADVTLFPAERRIRGRLRSIGGMSGGFGGYDVFFEARTKQDWTGQQIWSNGGAPALGTQVTAGTGVGFELDFDEATHEPIEIQVGLSLVSGDGAAANLAAEMPTFAFDDTAKATAAAWDQLLGLVKVTGATTDQASMLSGALEHAFLMPTVLSDLDGQYVGMDQKPHTATGFHYCSDLSLWDTYRTLHPFYSLFARDKARDAVLSLEQMAKTGGFFPKWPIATGEAGSMIGASAEVVLADAYLKGITGFDAAGDYAILRAAAMDATAPAGGRGGRDNVVPYMQNGYVQAGNGASVSLTIEYAQDDFALANLAGAVGNAADKTALLERSHGYRKLFDPETGFLWPKNADGSWGPGGHKSPTNFADDFDEANAWQTVWGAPHDIDGLVSLFGSKEAAVTKLEEFFELGREDFDAIDPANTLTAAAPRPYYWGGNEPDIHAGYMFAMLGRPDLTQKWIAWSRGALFGPGADGLPGNDDGGTMSTWWIWSSLGFYPLVGSDRYIVGTPLFTHAELAIEGGTFTVDAPDASPANIYVQSATLNGQPLTRPDFVHADLKAGGSLSFVMGPTPSDWGKL